MMSKFTLFCCSVCTFLAINVQAQYIYTFAGNGFGAATGTGGYLGDGGQAKLAELNAPTGVYYDGAGNVYIADRGNNVVRKVNTAGVISTFAGTNVAGNSGDNGPANMAKLNKPFSVASDKFGNVYISDYGNNVIRKVNTSGAISTYAGTAASGYSGDGGPASAARLNGPEGIATDTSGNLYIADAGNDAIRMVSPTGMIVTIAGNGTAGHTGDGAPAVIATLNAPAAVAIDPFGQVFIADYFNNAVRKIDANGIISTVAGTGAAGFAGDNGPATAAQLHFPSGVTVFGFGPLYVSDEGNNAVRMINSSGTISTVAGNFTNGYSGDGGFAAAAELSSPKGIAVDALNRLYVADYDNNVVRIVRSFTAVSQVTGNSSDLKVYPNPSKGDMTIEIPAAAGRATITLADVFGRTVKQVTSVTQKTDIRADGIPAGSYFLKVEAGPQTWREKITVW